MFLRIVHADCRDALADLIVEGVRVDSVVTDPPYFLEAIPKRFGKPGAAPARPSRDGRFSRLSGGFMGQKWDGAQDDYRIAFDPDFWKLVLSILRPGGYLLAFASPRTGHRMATAIEDAGFVMHPFIGWVYGQGFPKAHSAVSAGPEWSGWYYGAQSRKPALEPVYMAQRPFSEKNGISNIRAHGVGAVNIDGCRIHAPDALGGPYTRRRLNPGASINETGEWRQEVVYEGHQAPGRWPANLCHDGSPEVLAQFPEAPGQMGPVSGSAPSARTKNVFGAMRRDGEPSANRRYTDRGSVPFAMTPGLRRTDTGSAARFFGSFPYSEDDRTIFYQAKATRTDRAGSRHPTVKPIALLRDLVRSVTPPGGLTLDPFAGSGTTGRAALDEGMNAILIEAEITYVADIRRRFGVQTIDIETEELL